MDFDTKIDLKNKLKGTINPRAKKMSENEILR
jgi:hypothetical protein